MMIDTDFIGLLNFANINMGVKYRYYVLFFILNNINDLVSLYKTNEIKELCILGTSHAKCTIS